MTFYFVIIKLAREKSIGLSLHVTVCDMRSAARTRIFKPSTINDDDEISSTKGGQVQVGHVYAVTFSVSSCFSIFTLVSWFLMMGSGSLVAVTL